MVNIAGAIGKVVVGTKSANTAKFVINALKNESKVGSVLAKSNTATTKLSAFEKHIKQINSTTNLGTQKSTQQFNYLPKSAQENFDDLLAAGKRLGFIKTDATGNILSGSMERFLKIYDKNAYSKMLYLEQNFKNLEKADFKKLLNAYKTPEKMAANRENIQKWLQQKEELKNIAKSLEKEGKELKAKAQQDITEITGIEPQCRSKSFESIYDKISKEVLKGKEINNISDAKNVVRDLIGTRLILDDVSPEFMQKITDNICKAIESGKVKPYRISNYAKDSKRYLSEEQFAQIQKAAAKKGIEIPRIESDQTSVSGYVSAQMNFIHSNGAAGELQIRGKAMHTHAQGEHLVYDARMGKNLGKNIPELEKFVEPYEDAVALLKRNGLDKVYDKYIHDCYKYVRKYEEGKIKSAFKLPQLPKKLRDYQILKFENLIKADEKMEAIKSNYELFAKAA